MNRFNFNKAWYFSFIFLFVFNYHGWSQNQTINLNKVEEQIQSISKTVDSYKSLLDENKIILDSLNSYILEIYVDRDSLLQKRINLNQLIKSNESLILKLSPEKGLDVQESENIVKQQKDINKTISKLTELLQTTNLLITKIDDLSSRLTKLKATNFFSNLTKRSTTPFSKKIWKNALVDFNLAIKNFAKFLSNFWERLWADSNRYLKIVILTLSWLLAFLIYRLPRTLVWNKVKLYIRRDEPDSELGIKMRALTKPLVYFALVLLAGGVLYWGIVETGLVTEKGKPLIYRIWIGSSIFMFIWNYAAMLFQQNKVFWNKIECAKNYELRTKTIFILIFLIFIIDRIASSGFALVDAGIPLLMAQAIISSTIFAILLLMFFQSKLWIVKDENSESESNKKVIVNFSDDSISINKPRLLLEIIQFAGKSFAIFLLGAILLGYFRLADFIFHRIVLTVIFILAFSTVRVLTFWLIEKLTNTKSDDNEISYKNLVTNTQVFEDDDADKKILIHFWVKMGIDFSLILLAIPSFLFLIGFDWMEVNHRLSIFVSGFEVGAITISIKNIISGILIFMLIIILTRLLTSFLTKKFKKIDNISSGVNNTIITMIGYIGILIALLAALPVIGLSFSKLTVIVGALSVGIGFGLKNIVNDFVSGLILLFERPIKIGDIVQVQSGSGYIEKIKARATIIRTFDMATIIVPNSELVSLSILNWFYKGKQGRIKIAVGVDYGTNPEMVKQILLQCAKDNKRILKRPVPQVFWTDFGDSSLNFELRCYVGNYDDAFVISSEIHFQIFEKFKEASISIPFPQRDIHIKTDGNNNTAPKNSKNE